MKQARTLVNNYTVSARLSAAAPSARIGLPTSRNVCNVLFWLHVRHKHVLIRPHYRSEKIGWRGMGTNVYQWRQNGTYERPAPRPDAPASPIWLFHSDSSVRDVFWLPNKQNNTMIMPHYQSGKIGWRQRNVFVNESSFKWLKNDVRQGTTDRGNASIANLVVIES